MLIKPQYKEGYYLNDNLEVDYQVRAYVTDDYDKMLSDLAAAFNAKRRQNSRFTESWGRGTHVLQLKES